MAVPHPRGSDGPLAGLRVLEFGNFLAAPFAGMVFADFGADVIKIERPGDGDEVRGWRRFDGETSMLYRTLGRNKRSITLDLRTDTGRELALDLVRHSDVVLENFRPGTLERWGLGPDALAEANPDIIVVRISGYGQTGPYRDRAGFGGVAEAFGGLRYITGETRRPPVRSAASVGDTVAGLYGVVGALMLLLRRGEPRTEPQVVDVALYEAVFSLLESLIPDYDAYGVIRHRTGGSLPGVVPSGVYSCRAGRQVVIGGNANKVFARLMSAIGRADLADDPALADGSGRAAHQETLDAAIVAWTETRTVEEVLAILDEAGVPAGPVHDAASIATDEQYTARGMLQEFEVPVDGSLRAIRFPGAVPKITGVTPSSRWAGPELGAHTEEVLGEVLGLDRRRCEQLREEGVL